MTTHKIDPFARTITDAAHNMSSWLEARKNADTAPSIVLALLALYAHLRRFPEKDVPPKAVRVRQELNQLIEQDAQELLTQFLAIPPMVRCIGLPSMGYWLHKNSWIDEAKRLDEGWEYYHSKEAPDDYLGYDLDCWEVFSQLDDYTLAVYTANKLLPANHQLREKLKEWQKELKKAHAFFRACHCYVFMDAVFLAEPYLYAYRADLEKFDAELFKTILGYRLIVAAHLDEDEFRKLPITLDEMYLPEHGEMVRMTRQLSDARVLGSVQPRGK